MEHVLVRTALEDDLERLVALLRQEFAFDPGSRFDASRQRRGLLLLLDDRHRRRVVVAEVANEVVGMATAQLIVSTAEGADSVLVQDVVVAAGLRRRGIGRALLSAVQEWGRSHGSGRLTFLADRENADLLRFCGRTGWKQTRKIALWRALS